MITWSVHKRVSDEQGSSMHYKIQYNAETSHTIFQVSVCTIAIFISLFSWCLPAFAQHEANPTVINIGVLAYRGDKFAHKQWQDTIKHLQASMLEHGFRLKPYSLSGLEKAVATHAIDFVLTNPGHTVYLERYYGITEFASVKVHGAHDPSRTLGSVIFTRGDRDDLQTLADLEGATMLVVERQAFGGFLIAWHAIMKELESQTSTITVTERGFPHDAIVDAVLAEDGDVGVVRSCLLEDLFSRGVLKPENVKVLSQRTEPRFDCMVSSDLYPSWAFSKHPKTSVELTTKMARALFTMPPAQNAMELKYDGWITPVSYASVKALYREMGITPFVPSTWTVLRTLIRENGKWFIFAAFVAFLFLVHVVRVERLVWKRTHQLEAEQEHRRKAMTRIQELEAETARAYRTNTMAEMAGGLAHELNQPIAAILNYVHALGGLIKQEKVDSDLMEKTLNKIGAQGERAAGVVRGIFDFLHNRPPQMVLTDLRDLVDQGLKFSELNATKHGCQLKWNRPAAPIIAPVEGIQFQQVLMILVQNAMEACESHTNARKDIEITLHQDANRSTLEVKDWGKGLDNEAQSRVFDPFFTSKNSMGLGLSVAHTIVQRHHGTLCLNSVTGEGTTATVCLPTVEGPSHE